jgi:predicted aspartyl protease
MRKSNGTRWLAAIVALAAGPALGADAIPFARGSGDAIVVPVTIDGQGPFPFLLDTGTAQTRLDHSLAKELALPTSGSVEVVTMAGRRRVARSRIARLTLGHRALEAVDVLTGADVRMPEVGVPIRGVLGQSALARISYGIDYRGGRVVFREPAGHRLSRVPLAWREGRPAAVVHDPDARALALVLDTGLDQPVLFEKPGRPLPYRDVRGMRYAAATSAGNADLRAVSVPTLDLGSMRLRSFTAAVVADAAAGGREEDGLLPARLFSSVYFDREAGQIVLEPR